MATNFYLGALELCFQEDMFVKVEEFDADFQAPLMPATNSAHISFEIVNSLDIPETPYKKLGTRKVWREKDREIRVYNPPAGDPYLMSIRQNNQVEIKAASNGWESYGRNLRPWFNIHLEELLLDNQALILHSAGIIVDGKAIIFSAPSGTGKTTQTNLWHQYVHGTKDLNGDRTLLQKTEQGWFACGFPIYGSVPRCENRIVPIKAIVMIRQSETDYVRELTTLEKLSLLYKEITVPSIEPDVVMQAMDLLEDFIRCTKVIQMGCTMSKSAVDILHQYLFGESVYGTVSD